MVDPKVLEKCGCTPDRIREIFTCEKGGVLDYDPTDSMVKSMPDKRDNSDQGIRRRFESRIRNNLFEGVQNMLRTYTAYQAVDIALDSPPIQKFTIPLMLLAKGQISINQFADSMKECSSDEELKMAMNKGKSIMSGKPRISEIHIDVTRSYLTRRLAAIDAVTYSLSPLYKFDAYGSDPVTLLRSDSLTQRIDMMANAYNYRHQDSQCWRHMLAYGKCLLFAESAWDRHIGWQFEPTNTGEPSDKLESFVKRSGVKFALPHPTKVGYDTSEVLANINSDTGPAWLFYWDIKRFGQICNTPGYYNLEKIFYSSDWSSVIYSNSTYFNYYFSDKCLLRLPDISDPASFNDRATNVGKYSSRYEDSGCLYANHYFKINPKVEGIGEYDADVWMRLVVAGDCTVVWGEFMPSHPAAYGAMNWDDGRISNQSMAMALLGYEDQASMIMTQLIQQLRSSMIQLITIAKDVLTPDVAKQIEENANNADFWIDPVVLVYEATRLQNLGIQSPNQAFAIIQSNISNAFSSALTALRQLFDMADRLLILSPNELGQPNPREISAEEVRGIGASVQSMTSFIGQGPRELIASKKEILYDSLIAYGESFRVPTQNRYSKDVIRRAEFEVPANVGMDGDSQIVPVGTPIMGNVRDLRYDYMFDSRDGAERAVDPQGATAIVQLLQLIMGNEALSQKIGADQLVQAANQVIRLSGAPWPFQFTLQAGGSNSMVAPGQPPDGLAAPMRDAGSGNEQRLRQLEIAVSQIAGFLNPRGGRPNSPAAPGQPQPPAGAPAPQGSVM